MALKQRKQLRKKIRGVKKSVISIWCKRIYQ